MERAIRTFTILNEDGKRLKVNLKKGDECYIWYEEESGFEIMARDTVKMAMKDAMLAYGKVHVWGMKCRWY